MAQDIQRPQFQGQSRGGNVSVSGAGPVVNTAALSLQPATQLLSALAQGAKAFRGISSLGLDRKKHSDEQREKFQEVRQLLGPEAMRNPDTKAALMARFPDVSDEEYEGLVNTFFESDRAIADRKLLYDTKEVQKPGSPEGAPTDTGVRGAQLGVGGGATRDTEPSESGDVFAEIPLAEKGSYLKEKPSPHQDVSDPTFVGPRQETYPPSDSELWIDHVKRPPDPTRAAPATKEEWESYYADQGKRAKASQRLAQYALAADPRTAEAYAKSLTDPKAQALVHASDEVAGRMTAFEAARAGFTDRLDILAEYPGLVQSAMMYEHDWVTTAMDEDQSALWKAGQATFLKFLEANKHDVNLIEWVSAQGRAQFDGSQQTIAASLGWSRVRETGRTQRDVAEIGLEGIEYQVDARTLTKMAELGITNRRTTAQIRAINAQAKAYENNNAFWALTEDDRLRLSELEVIAKETGNMEAFRALQANLKVDRAVTPEQRATVQLASALGNVTQGIASWGSTISGQRAMLPDANGNISADGQAVLNIQTKIANETLTAFERNFTQNGGSTSMPNGQGGFIDVRESTASDYVLDLDDASGGKLLTPEQRAAHRELATRQKKFMPGSPGSVGAPTDLSPRRVVPDAGRQSANGVIVDATLRANLGPIPIEKYREYLLDLQEQKLADPNSPGGKYLERALRDPNVLREGYQRYQALLKHEQGRAARRAAAAEERKKNPEAFGPGMESKPSEASAPAPSTPASASASAPAPSTTAGVDDTDLKGLRAKRASLQKRVDELRIQYEKNTEKLPWAARQVQSGLGFPNPLVTGSPEIKEAYKIQEQIQQINQQLSELEGREAPDMGEALKKYPGVGGVE